MRRVMEAGILVSIFLLVVAVGDSLVEHRRTVALQVYEEGYAAGESGVSLDACPYGHARYPALLWIDRERYWINGWLDGLCRTKEWLREGKP